MTVSNVTYENANADVTGLQPGQVALRITSGVFTGELIRVQVLRIEEDVNKDGNVDQLNLKTTGAVINTDNTVKATPGGRAMECPAKVDSILVAAIAEGTVDPLVRQAEVTDECVYRMLNLAVSMQAWESIPSAG
ncbi:hypothetical protein JF535_13165 [Microbulbifer salipaludis]|uniref:Uncharacterized protein n=1 Tax=Microbulbifer salipaludis TaxID=187980 RepID=A0ABS3E956_9GAMM|nr:hypothetical protein [Microbulbifer salipaludis]MBN8431801.1 hypothetical protein [Microbulbifer salipaludis]